jgi:uncharacterized membrane protein YcaP (DUF421 family)
MKSMRLRRFFMGTPTIIIQEGKILEKNLKKVKFDINDMLEEIREQGYFDLSQIEYAIMEANGQFSIMPKSEYKPVTIKDMKLKFTQEGLCSNVVIDGKIIPNNLKNINRDEKWLLKELKIKGYADLSKILLVTVDNNQKICIYERNLNVKPIDVLE